MYGWPLGTCSIWQADVCIRLDCKHSLVMLLTLAKNTVRLIWMLTRICIIRTGGERGSCQLRHTENNRHITEGWERQRDLRVCARERPFWLSWTYALSVRNMNVALLAITVSFHLHLKENVPIWLCVIYIIRLFLSSNRITSKQTKNGAPVAVAAQTWSNLTILLTHIILCCHPPEWLAEFLVLFLILQD